MPTIPPRVPTQTQQPTPMPYQRSNAPRLAFGIGGEGLSDLGQGMMRSGLHLGEIASQMRAEDDLAAVKKAGTALSDDLRNMMFGSDGVGGYYAQRGQSAVEGYSRLGTDIDAVIKQHSDGLSNRTQQRMFDQLASRWRISELDQAAHHAAGQRVQALNDVSEGVIRSAIADGTQRFENEAERNTAFNTGYSELLNIAQRNGWSPKEVEAKRRGYANDFYSSAIQWALSNNPATARARFLNHVGALTKQTAEELDHLTKNEAHVATVSGQVQRIMSMPLPPAPDAGASLMSAAAQLESKENRPFESARLKDMSDRFGGNAALALAAYKAGPEEVEKWIKQIGDPRDGSLSDAKFAQAIPDKETQDYVGQALSLLGNRKADAARQGVPPLSAYLTEAQKIPDATIRQDVCREVNVAHAAKVKAYDAETRQAEQKAMAFIEQGGNVLDLPLSLRQQIGAEGTLHLRDYQDARIKRGQPTTDWAYYEMLRQEKIKDPTAFMARPLTEVRPHLDDAAFKEFTVWREKVTKGSEDSLGTLDQQINRMFAELSIKDPAQQGRLARLVLQVVSGPDGADFLKRQEIVKRLGDEFISNAASIGKMTTMPLHSIEKLEDVPQSFRDATLRRDPEASDQEVVDRYVTMALSGKIPRATKNEKLLIAP